MSMKVSHLFSGGIDWKFNTRAWVHLCRLSLDVVHEVITHRGIILQRPPKRKLCGLMIMGVKLETVP